jgi:RNA polymerase sigma-70 factor (ECF subfamily)
MADHEDKERTVLNAAARPEQAPGLDLELLFREHASRVLAAAYRVTGSPQDAEDVLQTVFLRLARRPRAGLGNDLRAYLHRAAVNAGLDLLRSRGSCRVGPLDEIEGRLADTRQPDPERELGASEIRTRVRREVARLSPRSAEIFVLRYFEGYDNHEIARMVGSSRSTVGVVLHRARERIRDAMRSRGESVS